MSAAGIVLFLTGIGLVAVGRACLSLPPIRRLLSRSWARAQTKIESASVEGPELSRGGSTYLLTVEYTYSVNGATYGGVYEEWFGSQSEAQDVRKSIRDSPPPARYRASHPMDSIMDPHADPP